MKRKDFLKSGALAAAAIGITPALSSWLPRMDIPLNELVEKYYGDPDDVSVVGRARKMQALIMELAIKAKGRNPKFQVVPQDTLEYAHIDGDPTKPYDQQLLKLLDGWGIENFSALTVTRLANLTKVGIKGTANTNGSTVKVVTANQKIAADNNILWHPRLSAEVYQSPGIGKPGYMPIYSPSSNAYNIIHDPIPAGVAHTINSNDVLKMMDAKNHLYMISSGMFANWPDWEANPSRRLDITDTPGYLVPFAGGRFKPTGSPEVVAKAIADHGDEWDFFWVAKGYKQHEGRKAYIKELAASKWDAFYIDAHFDGDVLTKEEVEMLKWKPQGGRRQVIAYLSIGTLELGRWYVDPVMVNPNPRSFIQGTVEKGKFIPARERVQDAGVPNWILWPAYIGQYAEESTPIWWHPEWRDIIIRGGSKYKNPKFNHSRFPDGRSSIDKIVDVGFDGVYLDNVSRATTSEANWTALQTYNNAHPKWYLEPSSAVSPLVLQTLNYTENTVDIPNPDRGFYRASEFVVPVESGTPVLLELTTTISGTNVPVEVGIVYMEFDLKNFSSNAPLNGKPIGPWSASSAQPPKYGTTQPLTKAALDYIRASLQKVRESKAVAIVKFNYDGRGHTYVDNEKFNQLIHDCEPGAPKGREWYEKGVINKSDLCNVPGHKDKNWIQYHLWQLSHVFGEFEDCIMTVKAGIFGPWGEMHSSSYARTKEGYHWLLKALLGYVPSSRSILAHAGGVMAWHNVEYNTNYSFTNLMPAPAAGTPAQRFGMFNDSYSAGSNSGGYNDNGSLSEGYALIGTGNADDFNRNAALTWIRNQNNFYGGETVGPGSDDNIYPRMPNVLYEAALAQSTHLNTGWNQRTYKLWGDFVYNNKNVSAPFTPPHEKVTRTAVFDPLYDGRNGMEYMRDRLGYRLVLREAKASGSVKQNGTLTFQGKIQNVGFGNIVNRKKVSVILKNKSDAKVYTANTDIDARDWRPDLDSRAENKAAWRNLNFTIRLDTLGKIPVGEYEIFLKINDPKETSSNKRCIQLANHGTWNSSLGANLIGSTKVVQ